MVMVEAKAFANRGARTDSVGWQKIDLIYVEITGNLPGRPQ